MAETSKGVTETLPGVTENKNVTEIEVSSEKMKYLKNMRTKKPLRRRGLERL